jgi:hypothetical protein
VSPKTKTLADHPHVDQRGLDWQAAANAMWEESGHDLGQWETAAERELPDFDSEKPEHVTREAMGGYLYDVATNTMHRVASAEPACKLDAIFPALFLHFYHEAQQHHPDAKPCPKCLPPA